MARHARTPAKPTTFSVVHVPAGTTFEAALSNPKLKETITSTAHDAIGNTNANLRKRLIPKLQASLDPKARGQLCYYVLMDAEGMPVGGGRFVAQSERTAHTMTPEQLAAMPAKTNHNPHAKIYPGSKGWDTFGPYVEGQHHPDAFVTCACGEKCPASPEGDGGRYDCWGCAPAVVKAYGKNFW